MNLMIITVFMVISCRRYYDIENFSSIYITYMVLNRLLQHPNIVQLLGYTLSDTELVLVMNLVIYINFCLGNY